MKRIIILFSILYLLVAQTAIAQTFKKSPKALRILTYNTHYCKGPNDPGAINQQNTEMFSKTMGAFDADIIALQELDSASVGRGSRYLLKEIGDASGIEYIPVYGNACPFDGGSIGCGILVRKGLKIKNVEVIPLPGDEPRAAVKVEFDKFIFIGTHSDLNNQLRKEGAEIICENIKSEKKPVFLAGDLNDSHLWGKNTASFPAYLENFDIISDVEGNSIPGRTDYGALIDYVLLSKSKKSSKIKVLQSYITRSIDVDGESVDTGNISDHYPVFVDVKI